MSRNLPWLPLGFVVSLLLIGGPYWSESYKRLNLPDSLIGPGLFVLAALGVLLALVRERGLRRLLVTMASCPVAVVAIRVAVDTSADSTSHNLWPFEIALALFVGGCAVLPALVAGLARRWWRALA